MVRAGHAMVQLARKAPYSRNIPTIAYMLISSTSLTEWSTAEFPANGTHPSLIGFRRNLRV